MAKSTTEPLADALDRVRDLVVDPQRLVRAVASGRRRGEQVPWRRVELRYVDLRGGRQLQVTRYDETQAHTANLAGAEAEQAVAELLATPFGNWHVDATDQTLQLRVTKRLDALVHRRGGSGQAPASGQHDRRKRRLLAEDDPVLRALGIADADGRIKPSRRAKYRQVEEFLRLLDGAISEAIDADRLRRPTEDDPLRIVDLGCGNAYLTFAAHRYLTAAGLPVALTGVDVKEQSREHNEQVAAELGLTASFVVGDIAGAVVDPAPEVVLALHACDTATDDALARAVEWSAPLVLAAPCCHHDVAAQLRSGSPPEPYGMLTRHGILRERLADTLTDALRAGLLRQRGYKVDVVEFVASEHTPRNTLLRATATGRIGDPVAAREYQQLVREWSLRPRLAELLEDGGSEGTSGDPQPHAPVPDDPSAG